MVVRERLTRPDLGDDLSTEAAPGSGRLTQTVKYALDVLWAFSTDTPTWGVNELGRHLGLHKSTVSRLLATMEERRLVQKDQQTDKYRLGLGILELAGVALGQMDLRQLAAPLLRQLSIATRETVSLAILDGTQVVLIEHLPSPEPIKYLGGIGHRTPAYCSSGGKAMLAFLPQTVVELVIAGGLERYTPATLTTREAFLQDLRRTRRRGYSINNGEYTDSLAAAAAPIWDNAANVVAAVAVAGPAYRLAGPALRRSAEAARETAAGISRQLGAREYPPRAIK
ncbi:MAG: IclR family transcriptional regulator [Chloroflexi bacterium]|nr:IclR family transcriptional regulator [Chloroflexota bacterium]